MQEEKKYVDVQNTLIHITWN